MQYTESMHYFFTIFFFVFGSLLGSFSNVVVLRMAIAKSVIFPPSACPKCNHKLHAIDLLPIFSWLFLSGKCRYCKEPISVQYPLVEFFMAVIVSLSFFKVGLDKSGFTFITVASAMAIWFVISCIFIRGDVIKVRPFVWAMIYSITLRYLVVGKNLFNIDFLLIIALCVLIGIIACIRNSNIEFIRWSSLSFLPFLYLPTGVYPYLTAFLLLLASFNSSKEKSRYARWTLFAGQLIAISLNLYLLKGNLMFMF